MKQDNFRLGPSKIAFKIGFRGERQVYDGDRMPMETVKKTKKFYFFKSPVDDFRCCLEYLFFSDEFLRLPKVARDRVYSFAFNLIEEYGKQKPNDYYTSIFYTFGNLIDEGVIEQSECFLDKGAVWSEILF